jgi:hypothetical protein
VSVKLRRWRWLLNLVPLPLPYPSKHFLILVEGTAAFASALRGRANLSSS